MQKTRENVKSIVKSILLRNELDDFEVTDNIVDLIAEDYLETGEVHLPETLLKSVVVYDHWSTEDTVQSVAEVLYNSFDRYKPGIRQKISDEANVIIVKIEGREFKTYLDENGTQRFKQNSVIDFLIGSQSINLNTIAIEFHNGKFSIEDLLEFYTQSGYSVSGLMSLSYFENLLIENPLWDE
jgi:hypothetical protein